MIALPAHTTTSRTRPTWHRVRADGRTKCGLLIDRTLWTIRRDDGTVLAQRRCGRCSA